MKYIISCLLLFCAMETQAKNINLDQIKTVDVVIYDAVNHHKLKSQKDANKSKFRLSVYINGVTKDHKVDTFTISPGALVDRPRKGKEPELTPTGTFHPRALHKKYVSKQFGGKLLGIFETGSMPNTIFFYRGFAIHGSSSTVDGKPASKGCVRLRKSNSEKLFSWVQAAIKNTGSKKSVKIHIHDTDADYVAEYRRPKN